MLGRVAEGRRRGGEEGEDKGERVAGSVCYT